MIDLRQCRAEEIMRLKACIWDREVLVDPYGRGVVVPENTIQDFRMVVNYDFAWL